MASNWDASLETVLDRAGLLALVDGVVPRPRPATPSPIRGCSSSALVLAGVSAGAAVHVGDGFREDVGAALGAGVRPVLLARDGRAGEVEYGTGEPLIPELFAIRSLAELPSLLGV